MALEANYKLNTVPEVVLKKRKRDEQWAATRRDLLQRIQGKKKNGQSRFEPFTRAEKLVKEYRKRESDRKRFEREATFFKRTKVCKQGTVQPVQSKEDVKSTKGKGKASEPEAAPASTQKVGKKQRQSALVADGRLLLVIQIRGVREMHRASKKILKELGLAKVLTGVFLTATPRMVRLLHQVRPFVTYGTPDLRTVRHVIMKRGKAKLHVSDMAGTSLVAEATESGAQRLAGAEGETSADAGTGADADGGNGEKAGAQDGRAIIGAEWLRVPLTDNTVVEQGLGKHGMICVEDLVQEVYSVGENFQHAASFLWPFELTAPPEGFKKWGYIGAGGDGGFRGADINHLAMIMA